MDLSNKQGVYKILNLATDHFYIGSAVNLQRRKTRHFSELRSQKHNNPRLQAAWNKHGEQNFVFTVLEFVPRREDLYVVEDKWLRGHANTSYCYNLGMAAVAPMLGMCGPLSPTYGYRHTPEAKAKIAAAGRGREVSQETRDKRSKKLKGRVISQQQRGQISKTLSGEGNYWYGKKRPDHGAKVRKAVATYRGGVLVKIYTSISELRAEFGATPATVNRLLKSGVPAYGSIFKDLVVAYVDPAKPA
jgi:group I intron endonuclease